jgi:hypothetical protein
MEKPKRRTLEQYLLTGSGIFLILFGLVFAISSALVGVRLNPRVPVFVFMISGTRELVVGIIVVFCAYRYRLARAGLISAIAGFVLLALTATSVCVMGQFSLWTALRILGALLLVVLGILFARRASK